MAVCSVVEHNWNAPKTHAIQASFRTVIYEKFLSADDESYVRVYLCLQQQPWERLSTELRVYYIIYPRYAQQLFHNICSSSCARRVWLIASSRLLSSPS